MVTLTRGVSELLDGAFGTVNQQLECRCTARLLDAAADCTSPSQGSSLREAQDKLDAAVRLLLEPKATSGFAPSQEQHCGVEDMAARKNDVLLSGLHHFLQLACTCAGLCQGSVDADFVSRLLSDPQTGWFNVSPAAQVLDQSFCRVAASVLCSSDAARCACREAALAYCMQRVVHNAELPLLPRHTGSTFVLAHARLLPDSLKPNDLLAERNELLYVAVGCHSAHSEPEASWDFPVMPQHAYNPNSGKLHVDASFNEDDDIGFKHAEIWWGLVAPRADALHAMADASRRWVAGAPIKVLKEADSNAGDMQWFLAHTYLGPDTGSMDVSQEVNESEIARLGYHVDLLDAGHQRSDNILSVVCCICSRSSRAANLIS